MTIDTHRTLAFLAFLAFLFFLADVTVASRAEITAVWRADEPAEATVPGEVCWWNDADLEEFDRVNVDAKLAAGDRLTAGPCDDLADIPSAAGELSIGVRCGNGTTLTLSGAFDIVFIEPQGADDCAAYLRGGTNDVITAHPATFTAGDGESGNTVIGVEGTRFALSTETVAYEGRSRVICRLFEGRLQISRPGTELQINGGEVWSWDGSETHLGGIEPEDLVATAVRVARLETARTWSRGELDGTLKVGMLRNAHRQIDELVGDLTDEVVSRLMEQIDSRGPSIGTGGSESSLRQALRAMVDDALLETRATARNEIESTVNFDPNSIRPGTTTRARVEIVGLTKSSAPVCVVVTVQNSAVATLGGAPSRSFRFGSDRLESQPLVFDLDIVGVGNGTTGLDVRAYTCPDS